MAGGTRAPFPTPRLWDPTTPCPSTRGLPAHARDAYFVKSELLISIVYCQLYYKDYGANQQPNKYGLLVTAQSTPWIERYASARRHQQLTGMNQPKRTLVL